MTCNLAHNFDFHGKFFDMPQICDMGQTALLPFRRKACWGFFRPKKIRRLRPGANPRSWVPEASMLTTRPPKPLNRPSQNTQSASCSSSSSLESSASLTASSVSESDRVPDGVVSRQTLLFRLFEGPGRAFNASSQVLNLVACSIFSFWVASKYFCKVNSLFSLLFHHEDLDLVQIGTGLISLLFCVLYCSMTSYCSVLLFFFCVLYCSLFFYCTVYACVARAAILAEVFRCFFLSCKANARVYLAKTGHGPHFPS
jgi:hypothetical protein